MGRVTGLLPCSLHLLCLWIGIGAQARNGAAERGAASSDILFCKGRRVGVEGLEGVGMYIVMFDTDDQRKEAAQALKAERGDGSATGVLHHHLIIHGFTAMLTPSEVEFLLDWNEEHGGLQSIECNGKLRRDRPLPPPEVGLDSEKGEIRNWGTAHNWSWLLVLGISLIWHMQG